MDSPHDAPSYEKTPEQLQREEELRRELQALSRSSEKGKKVSILLGIAAMIVVIIIINSVGRFSHNAIVYSHLQDGISEYVKGLKSLEKCHGPGHFAFAKKLFDHVLVEDKKNVEARFYEAAINITIYHCLYQKDGEMADRQYLDDAKRLLEEILVLKKHYPPAYYFLGLIELYRGNMSGAQQNWSLCSQYSEKEYGKKDPARNNEWQDKIKHMKEEVEKNPEHPAVDYWPIRKMAPG